MEREITSCPSIAVNRTIIYKSSICIPVPQDHACPFWHCIEGHTPLFDKLCSIGTHKSLPTTIFHFDNCSSVRMIFRAITCNTVENCIKVPKFFVNSLSRVLISGLVFLIPAC